MTRLTVQSGDFLQGEGEYRNGSLTLKTARSPSPGEKIALTRITDLIVANQESSRSLSSALGWGVAGALVAGPVGLIAGLWLGGKEEEVTFLATFKDGRKLMAITDKKTWSKIDGNWRRHSQAAANG
ncbi:hypothetical protein ACIOVF_18560 [Pseudomonas sp. NPDC087612]|uniref:Uncharacterized protein n=1 Tax=Pseudomonas vranovensis TaxID=321661 RepID=A0A423D562_9PSED|nr:MULTISPECIES: hypothetical protein [Pseudomonas]KJK19738.1 hypothetical protein UB48_07070 [Pseudomonas sp. 2(2015)]NLU58848.1 hypothetical protein [Pseudomonas sp. BIGb0427]QPG63077.1 hypothetical protein HFV04_026890 [Pseudomonas sp. BIGb0427]QVM98151.1 hypothetical protein JYG36_08205 [Pseudomonas sp. SORT22]ROL66690.1 hypothetical protein BHU25_20395 [Pseudomonas vranovensis]